MLSGAMFSQIGNWVHDWATSAWKQDKAEGMMEDQQNFARDSQLIAQDFSERMYDTRYQKTVRDLQQAGLNPMLAYGQGPGHQPSGAPVSGPSSSAPPFSRGSGDLVTAWQAANQASLMRSQENLLAAQAEREKASAQEIVARTPTHAVSIQQMEQNIKESQERIQNIMQQVRTGAATAANLEQQTRNLTELVPQIRATVDQLRAQTRQTGALTGLTEQQTTEVKQRIEQNLPRLDALLKDLERQVREHGMPRAMQEGAANETIIGTLGAVFRILNPLGSLLNAVR